MGCRRVGRGVVEPTHRLPREILTFPGGARLRWPLFRGVWAPPPTPPTPPTRHAVELLRKRPPSLDLRRGEGVRSARDRVSWLATGTQTGARPPLHPPVELRLSGLCPSSLTPCPHGCAELLAELYAALNVTDAKHKASFGYLRTLLPTTRTRQAPGRVQPAHHRPGPLSQGPVATRRG